uniref:Uncharacterized protein n=1 Tax=Arundo donax TaxID=35708 RepID=A0A0A9E853_ARUDO
MGIPEGAFKFSSLPRELTFEASALSEANIQLPSSLTSFHIAVLLSGALCSGWSTSKLPLFASV